ncbi:MAG: hypothetical protein ABJO86_07190 [Lentilitoribacter sp.]
MNNDWIRFFVTVVMAFALTGCVSTSLEDAAPTAASSQPTNLTAIPQDTSEPDPLVENSAPQNVANSNVSTSVNGQNSDNSQPTTTENNSLPAKPLNEEFPTFAQERRGETNQMTPEQKAAIEAQMTELLIQREKDPRIKARYQARLTYLRRLAKTHASETSAKIAQ